MWLMKAGNHSNAFWVLYITIWYFLVKEHVVVDQEIFESMEEVKDWACFHPAPCGVLCLFWWGKCNELLSDIGAILYVWKDNHITEGSDNLDQKQTDASGPQFFWQVWPVCPPSVHQRMGTGAGDRQQPEWDEERSAVTEPEPEGGTPWSVINPSHQPDLIEPQSQISKNRR